MKYLHSSVELRAKYIGVIRKFAKSIKTPFGNKVARELNRSIVRLKTFDLNPSDYEDSHSFRVDRQLAALLSKAPFLTTDEDPYQNCIDTYYRFEKLCEETNDAISSGRLYDEPDVAAVISMAVRKIDRILGPLPDIADLPFTFGPGASRNVKRQTTAFHKMDAVPECTKECFSDISRLLDTVPSLKGHYLARGGRISIVEGSRFGQVPKSAKTNRPIDIEPTLNGVLQRAYGTVIRNRLGRSGNCIRSGQDRHALLAREASVKKHLATIDKSGASDSIASNLVLHLLPQPWFDALYNCRSHFHRIEGRTEELHKFSAMGNGFTFELETLLFLSLARSVCHYLDIPRDNVSVYGDDVILPCEAVPLYLKVCDACGFIINQDKSFWGDSPFRESCGADFWDGVDVRVAYMRHDVTPHYIMTLHNRLVDLGLDYYFPDLCEDLKRILPRRFQVRGPISGHRYGYFWCRETSKLPRIVQARPRSFRPKGAAVWPYALYTSQFIQSNDLMDLRTEWMLRDAISTQDHWSWAPALSLERLTVRGDFRLSTRYLRYNEIVRDGMHVAC